MIYGYVRVSTNHQDTELQRLALESAGCERIYEEYASGRTAKEGANKQVISSQVDSLIKISRIWADFFPA
nr:hypothetical protein [Escherichia coli]